MRKEEEFPKLRENSEDETLDAAQIFSVTVQCPGSRRVISGGFAIPDSITLVTTSMRSGRGTWTVEFRPVSAIVEVEAFAYCAKGREAEWHRQHLAAGWEAHLGGDRVLRHPIPRT